MDTRDDEEAGEGTTNCDTCARSTWVRGREHTCSQRTSRRTVMADETCGRWTPLYFQPAKGSDPVIFGGPGAEVV